MQNMMRAVQRSGVLCILSLALLTAAAAQKSDAATPNAGAQSLPASAGNDAAVLDWVLAHSGPVNGDRRAGDLRVAYTLTAAEGWWENAGGGKLAWRDAPANQAHLRIFILGADRRLLPNLAVHARFTDEFGNLRTLPVDFGWYPLINAYGANLTIEPDHAYSLHVSVEADAANGNSAPLRWTLLRCR